MRTSFRKKHKIRKDDTVSRLRGKEFEPPRRKRDFHTLPPVIAFTDRRYGTQRGKAEASSAPMTGGDGTAHSDDYIDAQVDRAIEDRRHGFRYANENADKAGLDAIEQQADADREIAVLNKRDAKLKAEDDALGRRNGPSRGGYRATRVVLYSFTLPVDYSATMWTPLPPAGQWMLALLIGAGMVLAAHQAARKVEDLHEAYEQRVEDAFAYYKELTGVCAAFTTPLAAIVATAIWREHAFATEALATGGLAQSGAANVAFAILATLAFVVAVLAGISFRRLEPLLEIRAERSLVQAQREEWQLIRDRAERIQRQAELTLTYLKEREEHVIQAIRFWGRERKARVSQRAATVAMRERRKQAKHDRSPLSVSPAPAAALHDLGQRARRTS